MLASSRVLDDTEIVNALNLDAAPRADYVTADANLSGVRAKLKNLLEPRTQFAVEAPRQSQRRKDAACAEWYGDTAASLRG